MTPVDSLLDPQIRVLLSRHQQRFFLQQIRTNRATGNQAESKRPCNGPIEDIFLKPLPSEDISVNSTYFLQTLVYN